MSILLVDSYDSFTYNLRNLILEATGAKVITIHNDAFKSNEKDLLDQFLSNFDAIVIGPGPGNPRFSSDIGIIPYLLTKHELPILGICLGFQCFCDAHGADIRYLQDPVHGQIYDMETLGDDELFKGMKQFQSVRYHSLYLVIPQDSPDLVPLAYTTQTDTNCNSTRNFLMAAKHSTFPHYGVQYHPESICSQAGDILIKNFWEVAQKANKNRIINNNDLSHEEHLIPVEPLFPQDLEIPTKRLNYATLKSDALTNIDICEYLRENDQDFILLNSASFPGTWSVIGLPIENRSQVITHSTEDMHKITLNSWKSTTEPQIVSLSAQKESVWTYVANYISSKRFNTTPDLDDFPFVGGLVGFFSYEEGSFVNHDSLKPLTTEPIPDTKLCFIERFILHNLETKTYYVVSNIEKDDLWIHSFCEQLKLLNPTPMTAKASVKLLLQNDEQIEVEMVEKKQYVEAFQKCQDHLRKGDSYELCLTVPTKLQIPSRLSSWDIYKTLTLRNPSPYSCYMKFEDCELLSSSPERFLSWNDDFCQLRPIKGTVKNSPGMTLAKLTEILKTPKEMGENLMIVDLIRHDLYTFLNDVQVIQLMTVEEYKTVFQLVSVINGSFKNTRFSGLDILSSSLPPGSMTGAPKKRSVEILQDLEKQTRRGIYSGVCGYFSLNNKSDWSVVIRSCFRYFKDLQNTESQSIWRIGAGGAITVLSDCEGEWQEMKLKLESALQAFD